MGWSLPGSRLICLARDNLAPESFERIISPLAAWKHAEQDYLYDDRWHHSQYIVNIGPKSAHPFSANRSLHGSRSQARLKEMIAWCEVVCLNDVSVLPAGLFYIDESGALVCRDENAFWFNGADRIIAAFNIAVSKRNYRNSGGSPRATTTPQFMGAGSPGVNYARREKTPGSKGPGRIPAGGPAENLSGDGATINPGGSAVVKSYGGIKTVGASMPPAPGAATADKPSAVAKEANAYPPCADNPGSESCRRGEAVNKALAAGLTVGTVGKMSVSELSELKAVMAVEKQTGSKVTKEPLEMMTTSSGGKGNWNKDLNNPKPNTIYHVDGDKIYKTDNLARPSQIEATLSINVKNRNGYQQCKAGKCGNAGDEGGHLIASVFNGPGEKLNLLPMDGNLNKGAWKTMENTWAKALSEGKEVKVNIQPSYVGDSARPDKFYVEYTIGGGRVFEETFKNAPGGK